MLYQREGHEGVAVHACHAVWHNDCVHGMIARSLLYSGVVRGIWKSLHAHR